MTLQMEIVFPLMCPNNGLSLGVVSDTPGTYPFRAPGRATAGQGQPAAWLEPALLVPVRALRCCQSERSA